MIHEIHSTKDAINDRVSFLLDRVSDGYPLTLTTLNERILVGVSSRNAPIVPHCLLYSKSYKMGSTSIGKRFYSCLSSPGETIRLAFTTNGRQSRGYLVNRPAVKTVDLKRPMIVGSEGRPGFTAVLEFAPSR